MPAPRRYECKYECMGMSEVALNYTKPQRIELQAFVFVQNGLFFSNEQRLLNPPAYSFFFSVEYLRVLPVDLVTAHH